MSHINKQNEAFSLGIEKEEVILKYRMAFIVPSNNTFERYNFTNVSFLLRMINVLQ